MIVKIKDNQNRWILFDGADQVSVETAQSIDEVKQKLEDIYEYVDKFKEASVLDIILSKNNKPFKQIIAQKPVYVLNKEGKTIDKF